MRHAKACEQRSETAGILHRPDDLRSIAENGDA
jgi:hypothetical protein